MRNDPWARPATQGTLCADLLVPAVHCAGCIGKIERGFKAMPGIEEARLNLSTKRLTLRWREGRYHTDDLIDAVQRFGFAARPFDPETLDVNIQDQSERELLRAVAIAGFAAANVMLLSVSIWSGAADSTRDLFHWLSALIALPTVLIAGRPFFRSAWSALQNYALNMDVPISLAVILASGMSLFETFQGGHTTYFDAAVMLLFFLLVGRYLDRRMRGLAQSGARRLMTLAGTTATMIDDEGRTQQLHLREVETGMRVLVKPGERIPIDGRVLHGSSEVDRALITGEATPEPITEGGLVHAGTDNLTGPLTLEVTAVGEGTLLAEIVRLVEAAEKGRGAYVRLADRAAQIYAPVVHTLAALAFLGWYIATSDWHASLVIAIATLIITCPCALGLAVPAVQIVAANRLLARGIMMKDGAALEKLAQIDTIAFDKTGTLTQGTPELVTTDLPPDQMALAMALAVSSQHPLCQAIYKAAQRQAIQPAILTAIKEKPGFGIEASYHGRRVALGRPEFVGAVASSSVDGPTTFLETGCGQALCLRFKDHVRTGARLTVEALKKEDLDVMLLTGDRQGAAENVASRLGIQHIHAALKPQDKLTILQAAQSQGRHILMAGDGLNDTPALAAAHVSISPASAADISRNTANFVYMSDRLEPILEAFTTAKRARALILQNFALAATYNAVAIPLAIAGFATPLMAAIAMSTSSILVTANALRLNWDAKPKSKYIPDPKFKVAQI